MVTCGDARVFLRECPDDHFGSVITDPPHTEFTDDDLGMLLRVSRGPVVVLTPIIWYCEPVPRCLHLHPEPEVVICYRVTRDGGDGWLRVYAWNVVGAIPRLREVELQPIEKYEITDAMLEMHPGKKPLGIMDDVVRIFGSPVVFDPFCGSGTTLEACVRMGYACEGYELDPKHVHTARAALTAEVI